MSKAYTDRMNAIAGLRVQQLKIAAQIGDEIAKAWRLMPSPNLKVFASSLGLPQKDVQTTLAVRGIRVALVP